ncbi:MAG: 50S ribosomal protein L6 [Erysipelotrichales bacterium]|nr:50S ribosomal protein L6 [Erysipelotrichales bacterium]MBQ1386339.1 50S ribosomal protein L6 [Erysipelotrichales bacterium]MBQ2309081.1 50S ribosomal protein L6 [Erysipelotrichales bacterium]MBQ2479142.1 50S ribosomal protein L6 [Erysipelotrichales bacterium]MBQ4012007.1 50S ribosomal protein L6 [Erysipelotrichales bacterium]
MSRIGNKTITIPSGVELTVTEGNEVTVKGPKGTLTRQFSPLMKISQEDGTLKVERPNEDKHTKQLHGTTRALINNMVEGVTKGFEKTLQIKGIGYRAAMDGKNVKLSVGYSHPVVINVEEGLEVKIPDPATVIVSGIDKQRVGELAANIRAVRKPEPYKGKGIMYKDEHVRRKEGKTAAGK